MNIFDLLFIAVFFTSVVTTLTAAVVAIRGRGVRALRILKAYGICVGIYLGIVALTSVILPRRVVNVGEPVCFDDWCISVENVNRTPVRPGISVTLRLSSRARRASQRENGVVVYLTDNRGQRYDPIPEKSDIPFNVMLEPQESIAATRAFEVPPEAHELGVVITHEGGFPIGWFIIGYETWFRKPTLVQIPS